MSKTGINDGIIPGKASWMSFACWAASRNIGSGDGIPRMWARRSRGKNSMDLVSAARYAGPDVNTALRRPIPPLQIGWVVMTMLSGDVISSIGMSSL